MTSHRHTRRCGDDAKSGSSARGGPRSGRYLSSRKAVTPPYTQGSICRYLPTSSLPSRVLFPPWSFSHTQQALSPPWEASSLPSRALFPPWEASSLPSRALSSPHGRLAVCAEVSLTIERLAVCAEVSLTLGYTGRHIHTVHTGYTQGGIYTLYTPGIPQG